MLYLHKYTISNSNVHTISFYTYPLKCVNFCTILQDLMQVFYKIYFIPVDLSFSLHIYIPNSHRFIRHEQSSFLETDPRVLSKREWRKQERSINEDGSIFYKLTIVLVIDYFYMHFTNEKKKKEYEGYCPDLIEKKKRSWSVYFFTSGEIFL